jgi:hypothetical protein
LLSAAESPNDAALGALFGRAGKEIVSSGDPVQDRNRRAAFVERAKRNMDIKEEPGDPNRASIVTGEDDTLFPVPLVNSGGRWRFDVQQGKRELLARRISSNEADAIALCSTYVEAQHDYSIMEHDHSGVHQYAQRFMSSTGKEDGLFWEPTDDSMPSPLSDLIRQAAAEGYDTSRDAPAPYHGYRYRILTGQGPGATGGTRDYLVDGLLIGGFGLIMWPAEYGVSGTRTFIVNQAGVIYERDLGPNTGAAVNRIKSYNPETSWRKVQIQLP